MSQQNHKREGATAYRVVMNKAVFAIFVRDNIVVDAAPYAYWSIGKSIETLKQKKPKWSFECLE